MAKDINIHVKAQGTEQTKQQLDSVGKGAKQVGRDVKDGSSRGAESMDKMGASAEKTGGRFARLKSSIVAWSAAMVAVVATIRAVTSAIKAQMQAMTEHAAIAAKQQKSLLSLQYLGEFFRERPELRKEVAAYAEYGRRPFEEVASAWYNLRSKAARLTPEQREQILTESLELGRTQPEARLDTIVDMFSLYVKSTGETDINKVQNILQQTITEAGGGGADVAKYMPQFLPVGMAGGLTGPQAAGIWSHVTTLLGEPSVATTGLRAVFLGLQGKGTPESKEMLSELGIEPDMDFFKKLSILSTAKQKGKFGAAEAELLFQREGLTAGLLMLSDIPAMTETISNIVGSARGDIDMTGDMIEDLMSEDQIAYLEEERRRLGIAIENIKGSNQKALEAENLLKEFELRMREKGIPEFFIRTNLALPRLLSGIDSYPKSQFMRKHFFDVGDVKLPAPEEAYIHEPQAEPLEPETVGEQLSTPPSGTEGGTGGYGPPPIEPVPTGTLDVPTAAEPESQKAEVDVPEPEVEIVTHEPATQKAQVDVPEPDIELVPTGTLDAATAAGPKAKEVVIDVPEPDIELVPAAAGPESQKAAAAVPAIVPVAAPQLQTITNVYHNIDNSTKYYPRLGDDDRGPRVP